MHGMRVLRVTKLLKERHEEGKRWRLDGRRTPEKRTQLLRAEKSW